MARPRYSQGDKTAREKLGDAFWDCLREKPFDKVTVANIVGRAGVNRNTFYYYFEDLNDLARSVVQETALEPIYIRMLLGKILQGSGVEVYATVPDMDLKMSRVCLLAGRNSTPELRQMLRTAIQDAWSEAFGIDFAGLDLEGRLALEFAMGGFLSVIAYRADSGIDFGLEVVIEKGLTQDAMRMLRHIPQLHDRVPA